MRILVTGASGRAGWLTLQRLVKEGFACIGTDLILPPRKICDFTVANLTQREIAYALLTDVDAIVHFGNIPNASGGNPQKTYCENVTINANLFQAAHETGVGKIIFASSVQVIGSGCTEGDHFPFEGGYLPLDGNTQALPRNSYALSKANSEDMLKLYVRLGLPSAIAIRFPHLVFQAGSVLPGYFRSESIARVREGFSVLRGEDVATLVSACLRADLPGYRCYFPSSRELIIDADIEELREKYYPHMEVRKKLSSVGSFVDISDIQRETGWEPSKEIVNT